jgi:hypothetical protein
MTLKVLVSFSKSGKEFHHCIISRVLKKYGINKRRLCKKSYLNPEHITKRKDYYKIKKKI